jgi:Ca2+:H+ antiporter
MTSNTKASWRRGVPELPLWTILAPVLAGIVLLLAGYDLGLGIDTKSTVLLILSLFITAIALRTGRTIVLHGIVLLVIFVVYLFTTVIP